MSEPFEYRGGWYLMYRDATGKRKRKLLAKTKREAYRIWKAGLANGIQTQTDATFAKVADEWLEIQEKRLAAGIVGPKWVERVAGTLERFRAVHPKIRCSQITESVAVRWLPKGSSQAYERTEAQVLKQILGWAVGKHITTSPLASLKLEVGATRERLVSLEEHRAIVAATRSPNLRALLWFLWWTGARPGELRALRWEFMRGDCQTAILREHKTAKKGIKRTLYFPVNAQRILYLHKKTCGPVFVNEASRAWTLRALCRRIDVVVERAGIEGITAYNYRHTFITRAMQQGIHTAVVAEMTGTSVEMIARRYGHLEQAQSHIVEAARSLRFS